MSSLLEESYEVNPPSSSKSHYETPSPIPSFQLRETICGIATELLVQTFDDRIMVIVTQNDKIGYLTQASLPSNIPLPHPPSGTGQVLPPSPDSLLLTPLLGSPPNPNLNNLYSAQIATLIWWSLQETHAARRPVVVGLALDRKARKQMNGDSRHGSEQEEDGDDEESFGDDERERFMAVMGMLIRWPGIPSDI